MNRAIPVNLPRLCAITDRALAGGASHARIVDELLAGGARWLQVREKVLPPREFLEQARAAVSAASTGAPGALVLVNDRADIAMAAGAGGVHVGRDDLPAAEARRLLGPDAIVGISTHSLEEGIAAAALPVDYIAIGPVFATSTKPDAEPVVGVGTVRLLSAAIRLPVVGIGGIGPANARQVLDAGASGVAVIAALYRGGRSARENVEALLEALR
jgi:thiamine-phosphate pyrophosphorylase